MVLKVVHVVRLVYGAFLPHPVVGHILLAAKEISGYKFSE